MGSTNDLRVRIGSELNRALSDSYGNAGESIATIINREINAAIAHYESNTFRWNHVRRSEFATATAGAQSVSLPADFIAMTRLEIIYSNQFFDIPKASVDEANTLNYRPSMTANSVPIPVRHAIDGNLLILAPPTNATRTLAASYIKRFLPTSLTGSYTTEIAVAGSYSITVTTTASHNSRMNGWTTDGEQLIRARAKAAVLINYLKKPEAIQEAAGIALRGESFLSVQEMNAYKGLADETFDALATGKIKKTRL